MILAAAGGGWFYLQTKKKKQEVDKPDPDADYTDDDEILSITIEYREVKEEGGGEETGKV